MKYEERVQCCLLTLNTQLLRLDELIGQPDQTCASDTLHGSSTMQLFPGKLIYYYPQVSISWDFRQINYILNKHLHKFGKKLGITKLFLNLTLY